MPLIQQGNGGAQMNANLPVVQKPVDGNGIGKLGNGGQIVNLPAGNNQPNPQNGTPSQNSWQDRHPARADQHDDNNGGIGKIVTLPVTNNTQNTAATMPARPTVILARS